MTYFWLGVSAVAAGFVLAWWLFGLLMPLLAVCGL
jgi:hypothetical protein